MKKENSEMKMKETMVKTALAAMSFVLQLSMYAGDIVYHGHIGDAHSFIEDEDYLGELLYVYSDDGTQRATVSTPWGSYELRDVVSSDGNITGSGLYKCDIRTSAGDELHLELNLDAGWDDDNGITRKTYFLEKSTGITYLLCDGQRDRFAEDGPSRDLLMKCTGDYYLAVDPSSWEGHDFYQVQSPGDSDLTLSISDTGKAELNGSVDGYQVSVETTCTCCSDGRIWIDFVQVLAPGIVAYFETSISPDGNPQCRGLWVDFLDVSENYASFGPFIAGDKVEFSVGLVGYTAKGLPSGLKYDAKKGTVSGTVKKAGGYEATFTKKNEEDVTVMLSVREEEVSVGCAGLSGGAFTAGVVGNADGIPLEIESETGVKSVAVAKLPAGMKYDTKTGFITGAPTKPGDYAVTVTVTTKSGAKRTETIAISVAALPDNVVGVFNGFVKTEDGEENLGTIQLTTTDAGKLTAKVTTAAGSYSFGGTCWDKVEGDIYSATLATKKGETLTLALDSSAGWDKSQLTGTFAAVAGRPPYPVVARKNAFGKTWYFNAEGNERDGWRLSYAENAKAAALTVTLNADGSTKIAGKLGFLNANGKTETISVSASGYADVTSLSEGVIIADFAPVVSMKEGKATLKRVLSIGTNLWFDRSNAHPYIGSVYPQQ